MERLHVKRAVPPRKQQRRAIEAFRKAWGKFRRKGGCGEEGDPRLTERVTEAPNLRSRRHRTVGQHDIETMNRQLG